MKPKKEDGQFVHPLFFIRSYLLKNHSASWLRFSGGKLGKAVKLKAGTDIFERLFRKLGKQSHRTLLRVKLAQADLLKDGTKLTVLLLILLGKLMAGWSDMQRFVRRLFQQSFLAQGGEHLADRGSGDAQLNSDVDAAHP